jgi:hypothetical protein
MVRGGSLTGLEILFRKKAGMPLFFGILSGAALIIENM